jgi:uncharacterized protein (TIGR03435 family)
MKKRIQKMMKHRIGGKLNKKIILAMAGIAALSLPVMIGLFNTPSGHAQSQTGPKPSFEVVSVKIAENCGNTAPGVRLKIPGGTRYEPGGRYITCSQLKWIIMDAYQIDPFSQPTGGPGWIDDDLFQIEAKAEGNPSKDQMRLMVQSLLEGRFKLKMHTEMKQTPVYLLVVAKDGHKLQLAKDEHGDLIVSLPSAEETQKKWEEMKKAKSFSPTDLAIPGGYSIVGKSSGFEFTGKALSMEKFATALFSNVGRRRVIDKTGLTGLYDIRLVFADPFNVTAAAESPAASIFTAIREQLGLRLEESQAPFDHFVIDSLEKPSEN